MWNSGSTPSWRSSVEMPPGTSDADISAFDARLSWVRRTPFGVPVVPEVYGWQAMSSSARATVSNSGAPQNSSKETVPSTASPTVTTVWTSVSSRTSATCPARSGSVTTTSAPESESMCSISRALYCGFMGTTTPPARSVPWNPTTNCGRFGR